MSCDERLDGKIFTTSTISTHFRDRFGDTVDFEGGG
jgi:hypothetical protein